MVDELLEYFDTFLRDDLRFLSELLDYITENSERFIRDLDIALNEEAYKNNLCPRCFSDCECQHESHWDRHNQVATLRCKECGWAE